MWRRSDGSTLVDAARGSGPAARECGQSDSRTACGTGVAGWSTGFRSSGVAGRRATPDRGGRESCRALPPVPSAPLPVPNPAVHSRRVLPWWRSVLTTGAGPPLALVHGPDAGDGNRVAFGYQVGIQLLWRWHLVNPWVGSVQPRGRAVHREVGRGNLIEVFPGH